jgi:hypothetical protein
MERLKERIKIAIAWALPRDIAYWALVRVAAHATAGEWGDQHPDTVSVMDAMDRWYK